MAQGPKLAEQQQALQTVSIKIIWVRKKVLCRVSSTFFQTPSHLPSASTSSSYVSGCF